MPDQFSKSHAILAETQQSPNNDKGDTRTQSGLQTRLTKYRELCQLRQTSTLQRTVLFTIVLDTSGVREVQP